MIRLKDMLKITEKKHVVIATENYDILVDLNVSGDADKFFAECGKARDIAASDKYIVTGVDLLSGCNMDPVIAITVKEG